MLMVTMKRSPPNSRSARPSAVSVLPTPRGPTSRNTPDAASLRVLQAGARRAELLRSMASMRVVLALDALARGGPRASRIAVTSSLHHLADGDAGPARRRPARPVASSTSGGTSGILALRLVERVERGDDAPSRAASRSSSVCRPPRHLLAGVDAPRRVAAPVSLARYAVSRRVEQLVASALATRARRARRRAPRRS